MAAGSKWRRHWLGHLLPLTLLLLLLLGMLRGACAADVTEAANGDTLSQFHNEVERVTGRFCRWRAGALMLWLRSSSVIAWQSLQGLHWYHASGQRAWWGQT